MQPDNGLWTTCTVGNIAAPTKNALVGGPFGSNLVSRDYVNHGVPVIRGQNMGIGRWVGGDFAYVSSEKADKLSANTARPGDLLFTQRGTLGQVAVVPPLGHDRYIVSQSQMKLTVDERKVDTLFLFYFFSSEEQKDYIRSNAIQTGVPHTNLGLLRSTPLYLPPLDEQRAIASILGSLDDKIELNRRMNETLEEMARVLFKSWFVDFEPVRAKMEGRQPFGMDDETAALFPDSFEDSPLGEIPKGWEIGTLADCTDLNPESWSRNTAPNQITYVDLANTKWGKIEATQGYVWDDAPSRAQRILRPGDTIVGTVRPGNGSFSLVAERGLTGSTGFAVLRPHRATYEEFVYLTATSPENIERLSRLADGAAYPAVRPGVVSATQTVQPNELLIEYFSAIVRPLMSRIAAGQKETSTLTAIRDTLLPKLLSGEIRVQEAEKVVEETV